MASNSRGDYYAVESERVRGVTVKHTLADTMVCLSCVTADECRHSLAVREFVRSGRRRVLREVAQTLTPHHGDPS